LLYDGLYAMTEIAHVKAPMSLEDLVEYVAKMDTMLTIADTFWKHCKPDETRRDERNQRPTLSSPLFKEIVANTRNRLRPCAFKFA
jgi:hypothetical protein